MNGEKRIRNVATHDPTQVARFSIILSINYWALKIATILWKPESI